MNYSIDKCKLLFEVRSSSAQAIINLLSLDVAFKGYTSTKLTSCHYNYLFSVKEMDSYYVGISPNWLSRSETSSSFVLLEFNPNKFDFFKMPFVGHLSDAICRGLYKIMSFDIAVDMFNIDYCDYFMLKRDPREYFCNIGTRFTETRYLGTTAKTGHVKLYNKGLEQKIDDLWTRFEITVKNVNKICDFNNFDSAINLPSLYTVNRQMAFDNLKDIQRLVLISILDDVDRLYSIRDYKTRQKYEKLLHNSLNCVNLSKMEMYKAFYTYFRSILS